LKRGRLINFFDAIPPMWSEKIATKTLPKDVGHDTLVELEEVIEGD